MLKTYIIASFLKSFPGKDFVKPVENEILNNSITFSDSLVKDLNTLPLGAVSIIVGVKPKSVIFTQHFHSLL